MTRTKTVLAIGALIAAGAAWYAFRPERLFLDRTVNEAFPAADSSEATLLAAGAFHPVAHEAEGRASVYRLADGRVVLRLSPFATLDGPDLRVYLVAAEDATDDASVTRAGFLDLGALRGNRGSQAYEVSAGTDLTRYRAVTIWCRRFGVNFATASLLGLAPMTR